ncbi:peptidoglycan-associated lipoprotein Pal [Candidatus Sumerlaeota bacterium]|nr:peptidoglycan-associated lipoprotein Pal [Candidatus Sumerlaeota bacterium]
MWGGAPPPLPEQIQPESPPMPKPPVTPVEPIQPVRVPEPTRPTKEPTVEEALKSVYFDYDSAVLRDDARATLDENITWLKANSTVRVQIEGHCDERGTEEYNLALGERRANAAKQYLIKNGIDASRLFTISYGESRPVDPGHNETAWAKNRRAQFARYD